MIAQFKISFFNERTRNVHPILTCFFTYTQCTNYPKCMEMLIESYATVSVHFCIYKNSTFLLFEILHQKRLHLQFYFRSFRNFTTSLFIFKKVHRQIYLIYYSQLAIQLSLNLCEDRVKKRVKIADASNTKNRA